MTTTTEGHDTMTTEDRARDQALAQMQSIAEMVAALQCAYDRLDELREERDGFDNPDDADDDAQRAAWAAANERDAEELAELEAAAGECASEDDARERIQEDALSVEVRSDWASLGEPLTVGEFRIVLCTGGPHVEMVGDLSDGEPSRVRCLFKDWGTSGELFDFDHDTALAYVSCFYFGE